MNKDPKTIEVETVPPQAVAMRPSWDSYFMSLAALISTRSKDETKVGAVVVGDNREIRSTGYNGFPRKVNDDVLERHQRPMKYLFNEHAERNAIFNAARNGTQLLGCVIFISSRPPCADCARAIIQSGISEVVVETLEPSTRKTGTENNWTASTEAAITMLQEAGIKIRRITP